MRICTEFGNPNPVFSVGHRYGWRTVIVGTLGG